MKKIVFVCTGNTCRSAMAAAIFNTLAQGDTYADSCGIAVSVPMPASSGAAYAAALYGANLSGHISKPASPEVFKDTYAIYCMTSAHADIIKRLYPDFASITKTLSTDDIQDPFGGSDEEYEQTANQIHHCILPIIMDIC